MQKLFDRSLKWADLTNINIWESLGNIIRKKFSEVIYYDPYIDLNKVPERDRQIIEEGHNPFFWEKLSGSHIAQTRKQYQNLVNKYGKSLNILPSLLDHEIKEVARSYHSLYGNYIPITENTSSNGMFCIVTGNDISMQKKGVDS